MMWWLTIGLALATDCDPAVAYDVPFAVTAAPDQTVFTTLELWPGEDLAWSQKMLVVASKHQVPVNIVLPLSADPKWAALVGKVLEDGGEASVWLTQAEVPEDVVGRAGSLRSKLRKRQKTFGVARSVVAPVRSRAHEALLSKAGFRALLSTAAATGAEARIGAHYENSRTYGVVLGPGSYRCGADPIRPHFTPAVADRVTNALLTTAQNPPPAFVRVALKAGNEQDLTTLDAWLTMITKMEHVTFTTHTQARNKIFSILKRQFGDEEPTESAGPKLGRQVSFDELLAAANDLKGVHTIPRMLKGDLNPTQAYGGFLQALTSTGVNQVRLGALKGPSSLNESNLAQGQTVSREAVVTMAKRLVAHPPVSIPSALPIEGKLLNAPEFLLALAGAMRGEDPIQLETAVVMDPNATGLGWGASTLP